MYVDHFSGFIQEILYSNLLGFKKEGNHSLSSSHQSEGMVATPHAWHKLHKYMHSILDLKILRDSLALCVFA